MKSLTELLIKHEGFKLYPYRCARGKCTIGVGRNLEDNGISSAEAFALLHADIERVKRELAQHAWYRVLDEVRQDVLINMVFNLGLTRFLKFKQLIAALEVKNFLAAHHEMLDSKWALEVGARARELATMMKTGKYAE